MGRTRQRRKVVWFPKKRLPRSHWLCPRCEKDSVILLISREDLSAIVRCGHCKLEDEFIIKPVWDPVDVYSAFIDRFGKAGLIEVKVNDEESSEVSVMQNTVK